MSRVEHELVSNRFGKEDIHPLTWGKFWMAFDDPDNGLSDECYDEEGYVVCCLRCFDEIERRNRERDELSQAGA